MKKTLRIILGCLLAFIAVNAIGGGFYGLSGAKEVPLEWLQGSPFKSYFFPSLFLFLVIGGICIITSVAAFRNARSLKKMAYTSAVLLLCWIILQVIIIGYVSWMQPAVFFSAIVIASLAYLLPKT